MKLRFGVLFIAYTMFCSFPVFDLKGADEGQGSGQHEDALLQEGQGGRVVDGEALIAQAKILATNILKRKGWKKIWRGPDGSETQDLLKKKAGSFLDLSENERVNAAPTLLEYYEKLQCTFENQQHELRQPEAVQSSAKHLVDGEWISVPADVEEQGRHQAYLEEQKEQAELKRQQEAEATIEIEQVAVEAVQQRAPQRQPDVVGQGHAREPVARERRRAATQQDVVEQGRGSWSSLPPVVASIGGGLVITTAAFAMKWFSRSRGEANS